jgi:hypothetical protein
MKQIKLEECSTNFLINLLNSKLIGVDRNKIVKVLSTR